LAGAKVPDHVDGMSLVPAFIGETEKRNEPLFWLYEERRGRKAAVRSGKWKAIQNAEDTEWELYDLSNDIGEENDLASKNPELLAGMVKLLEEG